MTDQIGAVDEESGDFPDVCVVTHPLGAAGENATRSLLSILASITSVSLVTADLPADSSIRDRHEVIELSKEGPGASISVAAARFFVNQIRMCRTIARQDEEVILFFGATAYLLPILFSRLLGRTVVLQPRGDVPLTLRLHWEQRVPGAVARVLAGAVGLLERAGYRLSDAIITYTPSMAKELGLDRYEEKLYTEGARYVDTDRFYPKVSYEERDQVVGFLGRLDEEKGIRELADVAKRLPENVTFVFAGDGELREWLEEELTAEIESGSVEVLGWVDHEEVPDVLSRFRLLVLPSQPTEGLPTVILEAMACGTPAYATPVSGVPDVVREGETGFLMEEIDRKTVAIGIEVILEDENLRETSQNGRKLIEKKYSFEAAVKRYTAIITRLSRVSK